MKLKYIPNILSVIRILLIPVFAMLFFLDYPENCAYAALVYIVAGLTDILDGFLARRFGWASRAGRILDPLADKLLQVTALVCMAAKDVLPVWLIIPFILKEVTQMVLGLLMIKKRNVVVKSSWYGKAVTVMMCVSAVIVLLLADRIDSIRLYVDIMYIFILACTLTAIFLYIRKSMNVKAEEEIKVTKRDRTKTW